jgi:acyl carrier protein
MVVEQLEEIVRRLLKDDTIELSDDTVAADIPGWDSLAHVEFMLRVEEAFSVEFSHDQFGSFATVGELRRVLEGRESG